ncbi:type II toxin-antitoxin system Phd/YefM family antitoxin [Mesorhizobium sp. ASY16-5R]|uniref:type II toxin-antitoxin system Phd/YefM family antitoxin n=1 Tax=Mesorhizobium sp. ASY16-5R TaxID=3445772 RepID=UPI003FA0C9F6
MNISKRIVTTMTSRQFNQDTARAKREARNGPVFITDRGKPTHVLMTIEAYRAAEGARGEPEKPKSLREALMDPIHGDDIELIIPERRIEPFPQIDFD